MQCGASALLLPLMFISSEFKPITSVHPGAPTTLSYPSAFCTWCAGTNCTGPTYPLFTIDDVQGTCTYSVVQCLVFVCVLLLLPSNCVSSCEFSLCNVYFLLLLNIVPAMMMTFVLLVEFIVYVCQWLFSFLLSPPSLPPSLSLSLSPSLSLSLSLSLSFSLSLSVFTVSFSLPILPVYIHMYI